MRSTKQKSSGWVPWDDRYTYDEAADRNFASHTAEARGDCVKLRLWLNCPAARCQRLRGCSRDAVRCRDQHQLNEARAQLAAKAPTGVTGITKSEAPRFAMSSAEAAAAIAASIANLKDPLADAFPLRGKA